MAAADSTEAYSTDRVEVVFFKPLLPVGLRFAAGAMIWMVLSELVPDALEKIRSDLVAVVVTFAVTATTDFQFLVL